MYRKKILIVIAAMFLLLAMVLVYLYFIQKQPAKTGKTPIEPEKTNQPIKLENNPEPASSSMSNEEIQKKYNEFVSGKTNEPLKTLEVKDSQNQAVPLGQFSQAVGAKIDSQIGGILDAADYELLACNSANSMDYGIIMNIKLLPDYQGNLYQDEVKFMKSWENSLFPDTARIIFPKISFTQDQLNQPVSFKDGTYRHASIVLPDKSNGSIQYSLVDDYVIISSSENCLKKASEQVYSTSD
jgi:hypothetical protein